MHGFLEFANGTERRDTGKVDLQGMVDFMAQYAATPLAVDYAQKAVGISFPAGAPASYLPGDHVKFDVSSLAMTGASDLLDSAITVSLGSTVLGTFAVDNTITASLFDDVGKASVDVVLPVTTTTGGQATLTITGATTGTTTTTTVPLTTFHPIPQARVFDTRGQSGTTLRTVPLGKVGPGHPLEVQLTDLAGLVPASGVGAVSLNVTATGTTAPGYVKVAPTCGDTAVVSSVNFIAAGSSVANAVIAPLSPSGRLWFTALVDTDVVVDINGWFPTGGFEPIGPQRVFDTRGESGTTLRTVPMGKVGPGHPLEVQLTDLPGGVVPSAGVGSVSLNVTATGTTAPGYIKVAPTCDNSAVVSSANFTVRGTSVANAVIAPLSPTGKVCFTALVDTDVVVDINGWFPTGGFTPAGPQRVFDTRGESGTTLRTVPVGKVGPGHPLEVRLTGLPGGLVPGSGVGAVSLNVTATGTTAPGFVKVAPTCDNSAVVSSVNFTAAGATVANAVLAPVSTSGAVCFTALVDTDVVVDVNGWFVA